MHADPGSCHKGGLSRETSFAHRLWQALSLRSVRCGRVTTWSRGALLPLQLWVSAVGTVTVTANKMEAAGPTTGLVHKNTSRVQQASASLSRASSSVHPQDDRMRVRVRSRHISLTETASRRQEGGGSAGGKLVMGKGSANGWQTGCLQ